VLWPPNGFIYDQEFMLPAYCKPKLIPLKSVTLEKQERMQKEALEKLKEMERKEAEQKEETEKEGGAKKEAEIWQADDET